MIFLKSNMDVLFNLFGIDKEKEQIEIICGMCRGADMLGERFAKENNYAIKYFPQIGISMARRRVLSEMKRWLNTPQNMKMKMTRVFL